MRIFFLLICCMFPPAAVHAAQVCKTDSIPATTPDSQLIDNGNGTVTDLRTGLMWKQCLEGVSGSLCETGSPDTFTWQQALQQPVVINNAGFAGYTDWRLPNIRELLSIVEEQCYDPAINLSRFPNTSSLRVWSGTPTNWNTSYAWCVGFRDGASGGYYRDRDGSNFVRLVRSGQ